MTDTDNIKEIKEHTYKRIKSRLNGKSPGTIPNSFYNRLMFNLSNFWGALHLQPFSL